MLLRLGAEDSARLKRSFSLDIKSYGEPGGNAAAAAVHRVFAPHAGPGDAAEFFKPSGFKDTSSKPCQFSPVEEVSEQSTPEQSPDKEEADAPERAAPPPPPISKPPPAAATCSQLHRSGSMEENATSFLFGLSRSQQHLAKPGSGGALKGWHSDILLGPVTVSTSSLAGGWYLSSESTRFYSTSAILRGVQLRPRPGGGTAAQPAEDGRPRGLAEELARREQLREAAEASQLSDGVRRRDDGQPVQRGDGEGRQSVQFLRQHGDHRGFLKRSREVPAEKRSNTHTH